MEHRATRRRFLKTTAAGGALMGLGDLAFLSQFPAVRAAETKIDANVVRHGTGIEPIVRLLEQTPRERLLEEVAAGIRSGKLSYRDVLAGLLLAGVRNVQPRPAVGFKFHSVLVVNAAHLASLSSRDEDRWLPIFWALDYFKRTQVEEEQKSGWKMQPVDESKLPPARKAKQAFVEAMQNWDTEAADTAVAALARTAGANEVFELFYRYGQRDFRSIGHKAIFVANSHRTLSCIGWQHAEPVLRSLAFALLNHRGEANPAKSDHAADHPWRGNQERAAKIRPGWQEGKQDDAATREMLALLHDGSNDDACDLAVGLLNRGISPQSIWDALLVGSGELLMRQPGIIGLHGLTTANALHHAYLTSGDETTRKLALLQNCAFLPMFREAAARRGAVAPTRIDDLKPVELKASTPTGQVEEIFSEISRDRASAAGKVRSYLNEGRSAGDLIDAARRLIFLKGTNAHDYKFSSAVLEDYGHVSGSWRNQFLALGVFNLRGSGGRDNGLVQRTRDALKA